MTQIAYENPRLVADIGGSYARFALEVAHGQFDHHKSLQCADHADFHAAVSAYLALLPEGIKPRHAAIAIANPVSGDHVRMTNYHWEFSIQEMRERLGLDTLVVVNDFTALAMAVPRLGPGEWRKVGGGHALENSVIGVLGAGTGLGVSGLVPARDGWVALATEGGHASFAPRDEREIAVLRHLWKENPHASFERLLSARGLMLIHTALAEHQGRKVQKLTAPEITHRGLDGGDALCREALETFCAMLGTAASNLAVTLGALGGIYIGGNIVPRLGAWFDTSPFRARFEERGRFSDYARAIPTYVITGENATIVGASAILDSQLRALDREQHSAALEQIRRGIDQFSPAERRVAEHILAHPRQALNDPIADIARAAGVSQPTVIRFCRSVGCEGLSDFKLRLASSLTVTVPLAHAQVTREDSVLELGAKVLENTASAILHVREQLNRETIDRTLDLLDKAGRIEFHAVGHYAMVAQDAQYKFLRFGIGCTAVTDPRLQLLTAKALGPRDVAVIVSGGGHVPELLEAADLARKRGAAVVAITASQSPLAQKADLTLVVDHLEDANSQLPMVSRVLHLMVIDILAVGLAMRRSVDTMVPDPDADTPQAGDVAPNVSAARDQLGVNVALRRLFSHSS
jgi:glucokinase